jgi:hypothetical protein
VGVEEGFSFIFLVLARGRTMDISVRWDAYLDPLPLTKISMPSSYSRPIEKAVDPEEA